MSDLSNLTDEELNVRLAELVGYRWMRWGNHPDALLCLVPPDFPPGSFVPATRKPGESFRWHTKPRYCASLDACHEVERTLGDKCERYAKVLDEVTAMTNGVWPIFASARQRTLALIETLQPK